MAASDFTTFRADCHRLLPSGQAELVDTRYRAAGVAADWFSFVDRPDEAVVADRLHTLLQTCATTAVRGFQAGAFTVGW